MTTKTNVTPDTMDGATQATKAPDTWTVTLGRINMRQDGKDQPNFNLLLQDETSKANIAYHAEKLGFDPLNQDGEAFVVVQVDQRTKLALRQAFRLHGNKLAVMGVVTLQDVIANRIQGRLSVTEIGPVTLSNGGRAIILSDDELADRREKRAERRASFSTAR